MGRIQRQIWRAFVANPDRLFNAAELAAWAYPRLGQFADKLLPDTFENHWNMSQGAIYRENGKLSWVAVATGQDGKLVSLGPFETREQARAALSNTQRPAEHVPTEAVDT